ncbi:putative replication-associated protein [Bat associated cyclovirus 3]|uniref:Replication-associated protein n=1 Tax=Bat associated cyclovirus 3 TaxID=2050586 RepID=G1D7G6_9CIRC|nr:putative replication-associated protein [Bat associated cyclovirus 3]AEL87790.1 putative replication-associated protein [Bat associated cyclovirus 3]
MANSTVRRFVFTWNNYCDEDFVKSCNYIKEFCKYGIVGKELCPTTGTRHLQGFCNLIKPTRFSTIKQRLHNTIHIEKANGSDEQNQNYCKKSGDFFEEGNPVTQGQRTDLKLLVADINEQGITNIKDIASRHPTAFIKYHRGIDTYLKLTHPIQPRNYKTWVYYYWGPPGSGKSKRALEEAQSINKDSIYYKPRGLWWDGYKQQENVIVDDFYGWIKYDELLKICDRYPYKVQIKGGFEEFTSTRIWFTSNVDTDLLYKFDNYNVAAFERRITCKINIV